MFDGITVDFVSKPNIMRSATLLLLFAVFGYAANSQFTLRPQAGIENPITKISYNDHPYFSPLSQLQPQLSIRADYKFKKGFGPFVALSTSRSAVSYNFNDPETGMTAYRASLSKMQLQLQAGLQYNTKPFNLNKQTTSSKSSKTEGSKNASKAGCNHFYPSCCQRKCNSEQRSKPQNEVWSVRIQPSAGFAFVPSGKPDITTKTSAGQTSYTYNAGDTKTALITGAGFEFARNKAKFLTLSFNYFQGLGNDKTTLNTVSGTKATTTILNSKVSGWNASIGIPVSFAKKPVRKERKSQECREQNRIRCSYRKI